MLGQRDDIAGRGRSPIAREYPEPLVEPAIRVVAPVAGGGAIPPHRQIRIRRIAVARVVHRRCEILGQRKPPIALVDRGPCGRRSRHGDRRPSERGHMPVARMPVGDHAVDGYALRRRTAGIQADQPVFLGAPRDAEGIRPDAVGRRFDHGQRGCGGHRGIEGVTSPQQRLHAGRRGLRGGAIHHCVPRIYRESLGRVALG